MSMTSVPTPRLSPHPEMDALAEQVGEIFQYLGFKRIHGKIWAHLFLSQVPLDATTLVKRLGVSKALISFSIHDLLRYNAIREAARGRGRIVLYELNPDMPGVLMNIFRNRERPMLCGLKSACDQLQAGPGDVWTQLQLDQSKLKLLRSSVESLTQALDLVMSSVADGKDLASGVRSAVKIS